MLGSFEKLNRIGVLALLPSQKMLEFMVQLVELLPTKF